MRDEVSTKHMESMLHSLFQAVYAGDKNGEVLKLLKIENFGKLSEEQKVHALTRIEPENAEECVQRKSEPSERMVESDNYGLLGFIIRLDRVYCLKTILPLLPLYSVYERDGISPGTDTDDNKSAREILYKNKAVRERTVTPCETIKMLCQDINFASDIIYSIISRFRVTKRNLHNARIWGDITSGFCFPNELFDSSGIVDGKFERLRQELIVLSITITNGHGQSKAAIEAINAASECFAKAERIMPSIWDRFRYFNCNGLDSAGIKARIRDIDNVLQDIETVFSYIERGKQNVETLRRGKKRAREGDGWSADDEWEEEDEWEEDHEWESNNDKKQANQESLWKIKRDAFVLLAAQIFAIASKYKAIQCAKSLFEQAPDFVHVEIEGKLPLASLLTSSRWCRRQIVDMLVQHGARVGRIDERDFAELFTQKPAQHESCERDSKSADENEYLFEVERNEALHFYWCVINLIIDDNEDLVKNYRDPQGNTLLHIIIVQLHVLCDRPFLYLSAAAHFRLCLDRLLKVGINPTERNIFGQSVLHVLLDSLHQYPNLPASHLVYKLVQDLAPYFRDTKMQDENLLQNLFAAHHHGNCFIKSWIHAYQSIMENDVMDQDFVVNSGRTPWQIMLGGNDHTEWHWLGPCCVLLSDLCQLAIQKGCNISRSIDVIVSNPTRISRSGFRPTVCGNGDLKSERVLSDSGCCYLTLLKVLLNNGEDIRPLLKLDPANAHIVTLIRMISDPESKHYGSEFHASLELTIPEMYQICKAFVLYYPDCSQNLISSLMRAARTNQESDVTKKNEMAQKLHQLITTPRSLKFLAKRSILRGMQRKQVDRLPLPTAMKVYIQEDEKDETD